MYIFSVLKLLFKDESSPKIPTGKDKGRSTPSRRQKSDDDDWDDLDTLSLDKPSNSTGLPIIIIVI